MITNHEKSNKQLLEKITNLEKKLKNSKALEQQLQTLIDTMPDYVCFKDANGRWLKINKASEEIFQLKDIDFVGKQDIELAKINKKLAGNFLTCKDSDALVWRKNSPLQIEEKIVDNKGIAQIFEVTKIPVHTASHERKGLVILGHNITEHRKAEKKLTKRLEELEIFNIATVDRELKIISLKKEINSLYKQLGENSKYEIPN